jgi:hypothetical protein
MKPIGEGIQSLVAEKCGLPTIETHRIIPSITIILGQNSSKISQMIGEIWDLFIEMEVDSFNGHRMMKSSPVFEGLKIISRKVK